VAAVATALWAVSLMPEADRPQAGGYNIREIAFLAAGLSVRE